jgi:hypothetical protein
LHSSHYPLETASVNNEFQQCQNIYKDTITIS